MNQDALARDWSSETPVVAALDDAPVVLLEPSPWEFSGSVSAKRPVENRSARKMKVEHGSAGSEAKGVGEKFKKKSTNKKSAARTIHQFIVDLLFGRAGARCRYRHQGEYESEHEHSTDSHGGHGCGLVDRCVSARSPRQGGVRTVEQRLGVRIQKYLKIRWDSRWREEKEFLGSGIF